MSTNGIDNEAINDMLRHPDIKFIVETLSYEIANYLHANQQHYSANVTADIIAGYLTHGMTGNQPFLLKLLPSFTMYSNLERQYLESVKSKCIVTAARPKGKKDEEVVEYMANLQDAMSHLAEQVTVLGKEETSEMEVSVAFDHGTPITVEMLEFFRNKLYRAAFMDADGCVNNSNLAFKDLILKVKACYESIMCN